VLKIDDHKKFALLITNCIECFAFQVGEPQTKVDIIPHSPMKYHQIIWFIAI